MEPSKYWTPQQLRTQARIDDDDDSLDSHLAMLAEAAFSAVEQDTGRTLFPPGEPLPSDAPENALVCPRSVQLAILMLVAHWFDNPAAVNVGNITSEMPLGYFHLVRPHTWYSL